jgi:hypothetical protein
MDKRIKEVLKKDMACVIKEVVSGETYKPMIKLCGVIEQLIKEIDFLTLQVAELKLHNMKEG